MSEVLIQADNVGKKFCRDLKKSLWYGVKDSATDLFGGGNGKAQLRKHEFWANKDISFEVKRGECLGLIGRNGAGKTTLLKMLNGLIKPDVGHIKMKGRVAALIALGAGFNPILTGRENIYVNGAILGMSKREIDAKLDEIVEFAELPDFMDSPVRTYSSGMQVRLGFAVAVVLLKPDILLLDEVLAVGDNAFRAKSLNTVTEMLAESAVIFVSHSEVQVKRICDHALFLADGRVKLHTSDVFEAFLDYNFANGAPTDAQMSRWKTPKADVLACSVSPDVFSEGCTLQSAEPLVLRIRGHAKVPLHEGLARLIVRSSSGEVLIAFEAEYPGCLATADEVFEILFRIDRLGLATGYYMFGFQLFNKANHQIIFATPELFSAPVVARFAHGGWVNGQADISVTRVSNSTRTVSE